MYVKIPDDLKEPLLRELRSLHLRMALKYFPILALFFSFFAVLGVLYEGHPFIAVFQHFFKKQISDTTFLISVVSGTTLVTIGLLIYFIRNKYNECHCWDYLYCRRCDAVDSSDNGFCPICHANLGEKAAFYFIDHKEDLEIIKKWGLRACKES